MNTGIKVRETRPEDDPAASMEALLRYLTEQFGVDWQQAHAANGVPIRILAASHLGRVGCGVIEDRVTLYVQLTDLGMGQNLSNQFRLHLNWEFDPDNEGPNHHFTVGCYSKDETTWRLSNALDALRANGLSPRFLCDKLPGWAQRVIWSNSVSTTPDERVKLVDAINS